MRQGCKPLEVRLASGVRWACKALEALERRLHGA